MSLGGPHDVLLDVDDEMALRRTSLIRRYSDDILSLVSDDDVDDGSVLHHDDVHNHRTFDYGDDDDDDRRRSQGQHPVTTSKTSSSTSSSSYQEEMERQRKSIIRRHSDEILELVSGGANNSQNNVIISSSTTVNQQQQQDEVQQALSESPKSSRRSKDTSEHGVDRDGRTLTTTTIGKLSSPRSESIRNIMKNSKNYYNTSTLPLTDDDDECGNGDGGGDDGGNDQSEEFLIEDIPKVRYSGMEVSPPPEENVAITTTTTPTPAYSDQKDDLQAAKERAREEGRRALRGNSTREYSSSSSSTYPSQIAKYESSLLYPSQDAKTPTKSLYPPQKSKEISSSSSISEQKQQLLSAKSKEEEVMSSSSAAISSNSKFPQKQQLQYASSPKQQQQSKQRQEDGTSKGKMRVSRMDMLNVKSNDMGNYRETLARRKVGKARAGRDQQQQQLHDDDDRGDGLEYHQQQQQQPQQPEHCGSLLASVPVGGGMLESESTMLLAAMMAPDLNRDTRYTPQPGAQRIRGICASSDDDDVDLDDYDIENDFDCNNNNIEGSNHESNVPSVSTGNNETATGHAAVPPTDLPTRAVSLANADNPIEAMLVDEEAQNELEKERERELLEREAAIKAKEKALEEQMASLRAAQSQVATQSVVVHATAVDPDTKKKTKKGIKKIFNMFSRSTRNSTDNDDSDVKNAAVPVPPPMAMVSAAPRPPQTMHQLSTPAQSPSQTTPNTSLPRFASSSSSFQGSTASVPGLVRHTSDGTFMSASQVRPDPHRTPNLRVALLSMKELDIGKMVRAGKFNTAYWVQSFNLDEAAGKELLKEVSQAQVYSSDQDNANDYMPRIQAELRRTLSSQINQESGNKIVGGGRKRNNKTKQLPKYVIKMLNRDDPKMDPRLKFRAAAQLAHEAMLLSHFEHDHIISLSGMAAGFSTTSPNPDFFCVLDYIPETLDLHLTKRWKRGVRGPQQFAERISVAVQLASAIDYLHSINVMFCDLKPENVGFVPSQSESSDGTNNSQCLKLFNFGGAKSLMGRASKTSYDLTASTTSPFVGSHPYVAPEVEYQRPSGLAIDTYAFSIILWEIMTLKEPFAGLMIHEYKEKVILNNKRPKLDKTPKELHGIMSSCWDAHPLKRPCMKDVHLQLVQFQQQFVTAEMKKGGFR